MNCSVRNLLVMSGVAALAAGCSMINLEVEGLPNIERPTSARQAAEAGEEAEKAKQGQKAEPTGDLRQASIELPRAFSNPMRVSDLGGTTDKSTTDILGNQSGCFGSIVSQPVLEFEVTEGLGNVQVSVPSSLDLLMIYHAEQDLYWCAESRSVGQEATIRFDEWPAGTWHVYVGHRNRNQALEASVTIEDLDRPIELGWSEDIEKKRFARGPEELIEFTGQTAGIAGEASFHHGERCREHYFTNEPAMLFDVQRPITDLQLAVASPDNVGVHIRGPISDDNRSMPARCFGRGVTDVGRLEPGSYAVFVASPTNGATVPYSLIWGATDHERDPLYLVSNVPEELEVGQRHVRYFFPYFDDSRIMRVEDQTLALFQKAPKQLFLFPNFDLDDASARAHYTVDEEPQFPLENEPLLWLGRSYFVAADGAIFDISWDYLSGEPSGAVQLPETVRNNQRQGSQIRENLHHANDVSARDAFSRVADNHNSCVQRVWQPVQREYSALRNTAIRSARENERMYAIEEQYNARERSQCPASRVSDAREVLEAALHQNRLNRRTRALEQNRERLQQLW